MTSVNSTDLWCEMLGTASLMSLLLSLDGGCECPDDAELANEEEEPWCEGLSSDWLEPDCSWCNACRFDKDVAEKRHKICKLDCKEVRTQNVTFYDVF